MDSIKITGNIPKKARYNSRLKCVNCHPFGYHPRRRYCG
jgi:hypothetical protein